MLFLAFCVVCLFIVVVLCLSNNVVCVSRLSIFTNTFVFSLTLFQ